MINFALGPEDNESLVRWPPDDYCFDENRYGKSASQSACPIGHGLKLLYPELNHWEDGRILSAWFSFTESTTWGDWPIPKVRYNHFIAFLYAKQELVDYGHGCLDELDAEWKKIGK